MKYLIRGMLVGALLFLFASCPVRPHTPEQVTVGGAR